MASETGINDPLATVFFPSAVPYGYCATEVDWVKATGISALVSNRASEALGDIIGGRFALYRLSRLSGTIFSDVQILYFHLTTAEENASNR